MSEQTRLTPEQKIGTLAGTLLFVIKGLRDGTIKSKPVTIMDEDAEQWPTVSLEELIWRDLGKCGIRERKEASK